MQNKLWFKRKAYGRGWVPISWQGWSCILLYMICIYASVNHIYSRGYDEKTLAIMTAAIVCILSACLIAVSYMKGEKPRWQWGRK